MHSPWQRACLCKKCRILHVHKELMRLVIDSFPFHLLIQLVVMRVQKFVGFLYSRKRMPTFHSWMVILHLITPNSLTGTIIEHARSCTKFDARHVSRHFKLPPESVAVRQNPGPSKSRSVKIHPLRFGPSKSRSVKIHPCNMVRQNPVLQIQRPHGNREDAVVYLFPLNFNLRENFLPVRKYISKNREFGASLTF